ncbi:STAS domain-containing protein [Actinoplanes sp. NPDC024001]|uniref:STAS domain-containing protein n=1 Tax=Actinoplanes sp. NPDC024001 TaxID=3154598 RepID=UPI0033DACE2B
MNITVHHGGSDVVRLHLSGDLDLATADALERLVLNTLATHHPRRLVIDADELGFCDSSGIHVLIKVRAFAHRHGSTFQVTNLHGRSQRALAITGVLEKLTSVSEPPPPPAE